MRPRTPPDRARRWKPALGIRNDVQPHVVALLSVSVLAGVAGLISPGNAAGSVIQSLPDPLRYGWNGGLLAGGVVGLLGICIPRQPAGPLIERAGLLILAGLWLGYGIGAVTMFGARGLTFGLLVSGFALANVVRGRQIKRQLATVAAAAAYTGSADQLGGSSGDRS